MTNKSVELKACPFCGEQPNYDEHSEMVQCQCDNGACTAEAYKVENWNTRTSPQSPEAKIAETISLLKGCSRYIEPIMTEGSCYKFHLFLKSIYPQAIPMFGDDHVVSEIDGLLYDINGLVLSGDYLPLSTNDIEMVEKFSFDRTMVLSIKECPHCDEPILYDDVCETDKEER